MGDKKKKRPEAGEFRYSREEAKVAGKSASPGQESEMKSKRKGTCVGVEGRCRAHGSKSKEDRGCE